eukprot:CAMPEP_0205892594 /NCGR_PEP_ID=MMETSP1083-20121108/22769_1 /ASSEMBLY_ACC=CAM_ASM_000430 /TAXON_ID=97485 /ORGANISM="Prymnesium parvum, Strain Texoma1" /LENGTH=52 /DNA_ID=CAMNT_0053257141 /DNA_START=35 /DNA_END=190 /DNA_ORIENTATION=+
MGNHVLMSSSYEAMRTPRPVLRRNCFLLVRSVFALMDCPQARLSHAILASTK